MIVSDRIKRNVVLRMPEKYGLCNKVLFLKGFCANNVELPHTQYYPVVHQTEFSSIAHRFTAPLNAG